MHEVSPTRGAINVETTLQPHTYMTPHKSDKTFYTQRLHNLLTLMVSGTEYPPCSWAITFFRCLGLSVDTIVHCHDDWSTSLPPDHYWRVMSAASCKSHSSSDHTPEHWSILGIFWLKRPLCALEPSLTCTVWGQDSHLAESAVVSQELLRRRLITIAHQWTSGLLWLSYIDTCLFYHIWYVCLCMFVSVFVWVHMLGWLFWWPLFKQILIYNLGWLLREFSTSLPW